LLKVYVVGALERSIAAEGGMVKKPAAPGKESCHSIWQKRKKS
jgi:hypothetical protein